MKLSKSGVFVLLCAINLINYLDRGIISGAPDTFNAFIGRTLHVSAKEESVYLGFLASAFIASYSVVSMIFGYAASKYRPFRMIALGMSIWVLAVFICGVARILNSYYILILGRLLSGVGEASFQCNATPFLYTHASPKTRAAWLGFFLIFVVVGQALGYIYGALFANSQLTWAGAYIIEGIVMTFLIILCLVAVPEHLNTMQSSKSSSRNRSSHNSRFTQCDITTQLMDHGSTQSMKRVSKLTPTLSGIPEAEEALPEGFIRPEISDPSLDSFWSQVGQIFRHPVFTLIVLGHAANTFSLAGLNVFSPTIFLGLRLFDNETQVSFIFGAIVVAAGAVGTLLGGVLVHLITQDDTKSNHYRCYHSVLLLFTSMVAAFGFACFMMFFTSQKVVFLSLLAVSLLFLCALSLAETIAVMECFSLAQRPLAISCNTLIIHLLGDVPSPIILGWLKDTWAPHCGSIEIDGRPQIDPDCVYDQGGLRKVLWFTALWLLWSVITWGAALWILIQQRGKRRLRSAGAHE
ncbi:unnamed protein product [Albugo candida]|uniref:Major facilitator superfamily (MFS) profile domain-containing protein n=1 Tax=Albugo candida TaxID=65357 RepID=A0A024GGM5_9STRA|nr:unnamed protein product [Albugo candida]|eukprot:CCI45485.1 unnamed protein product [Albugo candida]